jgi:hypothetical protein
VRGQVLGLALARTAAGATEPLPWVTIARLSLEDGNDAQFRQATQVLAEQLPDNEYTPFFNGVRQLQDGDWPGAEQSLRRAAALGIPAACLPALLQIAVDNQHPAWGEAKRTLVAIGACMGGLGLLVVTGTLLPRWLRRGGAGAACVERPAGTLDSMLATATGGVISPAANRPTEGADRPSLAEAS